MKILICFFDMLRIGLSNIYDSSNTETSFDREMRKIGGTLFTNCFSPAPDTPRSLACLWTSQYPHANKCDSRLKYPKYYLKGNSFLEILGENGYTLNFFLTTVEKNLGELPQYAYDAGNFSNDNESLSSFLDRLTIEENSLTFIGLDDFHQVVNDTYAQKKYAQKAFNLIGEAIDLIDKRLDYNSFDIVVMLSDHGFKALEEHFKSDMEMLGNERTQILMFLRKKGDTGLSYCNKLSSIMDVYPTLLAECSIPVNEHISGKNLLDTSDEYAWLLTEDHVDFSVSLGQTIERWCIRTADGMACVNCALKWESDYSLLDSQKEDFSAILSQNASCFDDNVQMHKIHAFYDVMAVSGNYYFNGEKRKKKKPILISLIEIWHKLYNLI